MEHFSSSAVVLPEGMEFVRISSGSFMMGSPESEQVQPRDSTGAMILN